MSKLSKRTRNLIFMGGAVILAAVIFLLVNKFAPLGEEVEVEEAEKVSFFDMDASNVKQIQWEVNGEKFSFIHAGGQWTDAEDGDFPVSAEKIESFLDRYLHWPATRKLEQSDSEEKLSDADMGFTDPAVLMTINDGTAYAIIIGGKNVTGESYYAKNGDGSIYMLREDDVKALSLDRKDIFQKESIPSLTTLKKVEAYDENEKLLIGVEKNESVYTRTDTGDPLDSELCDNYFGKVAALAFGDYYTYTADQEDISEYGYSGKPQIFLLTYDDNGTDRTLKFSVASNSPDSLYRGIKYEDSQIIYKLTNTWYSETLVSYEDLMAKEEETSSASSEDNGEEKSGTETSSTEK